MAKRKFLVDNVETLSKYNIPVIDLWYPRIEENVKEIEIGLMDVRAADSILVSYDFERDGWVVKQASTFQWEISDAILDPDWQEVAFIQAWGRKKEEQ